MMDYPDNLSPKLTEITRIVKSKGKILWWQIRLISINWAQKKGELG